MAFSQLIKNGGLAGRSQSVSDEKSQTSAELPKRRPSQTAWKIDWHDSPGRARTVGRLAPKAKSADNLSPSTKRRLNDDLEHFWSDDECSTSSLTTLDQKDASHLISEECATPRCVASRGVRRHPLVLLKKDETLKEETPSPESSSRRSSAEASRLVQSGHHSLMMLKQRYASVSTSFSQKNGDSDDRSEDRSLLTENSEETKTSNFNTDRKRPREIQGDETPHNNGSSTLTVMTSTPNAEYEQLSPSRKRPNFGCLTPLNSARRVATRLRSFDTMSQAQQHSKLQISPISSSRNKKAWSALKADSDDSFFEDDLEETTAPKKES